MAPLERDIYTIADLIAQAKEDDPDPLTLAAKGYATLGRARLLKNPTTKCTDDIGFLAARNPEIEVMLPLALVGYAGENPDDTHFERFLPRAVESLRQNGVVMGVSPQPHSQPRAHTPLIDEGTDTSALTTMITPRVGPRPTDVAAETLAKVRGAIVAERTSLAVQKQAMASQAALAIIPQKPKIYTDLQSVPEFKDGALEKLVEHWANFYAKLYSEAVSISPVYDGDCVAELRSELFRKAAWPLVTLQRDRGGRSFFEHLRLRATDFDCSISFDAGLAPSSIMCMPSNFKDPHISGTPVTGTGSNVYYDADHVQKLKKQPPMKDGTTSVIRFFREEWTAGPGVTQYARVANMASIEEVVAMFLFSASAPEDVAKYYRPPLPIDTPCHVQNCTRDGKAVVVKRTSMYALRIGEMDPTTRLNNLVRKV